MKSLNICIEALRGALQLSRQAIQTEVAVCFVVFYEHEGVINQETMKALRSVYAQAGKVDCITPESRSYKTISRRMNRCADLYETVKHAKMKKVLKDVPEKGMIAAIKEFLAPFEIESMDDVAAHAGNPRKPADKPAEKAEHPHDRRTTDEPGTIHVKTKHIDVPIPPDTTKTEVLSLIKKLTAIADKMD